MVDRYARRQRPRCMVQFYGRYMGHFRASTCTSTWPAPARCGQRWSRRCARRCGPAGWRPAPGCRPRARWPPTSAIARNTVAEAYAPARRRGLADRPAGLGHAGGRAVAAADPAGAGAPGRGRRARAVRATTCGRARPTCRAFPRAAWLAAARRALARRARRGVRLRRPARAARAARRAGRLPRPRPRRARRPRTASWSAPASPRGWRCSARCCAARGRDRVGVEAYGQPRTATRGRAGLRPAAARRSTTHGAVVGELGDADAVLLTPAHQFPLGVALAPRRRAAPSRLGRATRRVVIEDDYDGEFRYDRQPVGAHAGARARPRRLRRHRQQEPGARAAARLAGRCPPALLDERGRGQGAAPTGTAARSTSSPWPSSSPPARYDRHVRRSRLAYRRRRDRLVAALRPARARRARHRHRGRPARAARAARRARRGRGRRPRRRGAGWPSRA